MEPEPRFRSFNKNALTKIAYARGGFIEFPKDVDNNIQHSQIVTAKCKYGHSWTVPAGNVYEWCAICKITDKLIKPPGGNPSRCTQNSYVYGQNRFDFVCQYGHVCSYYGKDADTTCRTCVMIKKLSPDVRVDIMKRNVNKDTLFRMHCNRLRHDPCCQNEECRLIREGSIDTDRSFSEDCKNFIICDQDFYTITKNTVRALPKCEKNHIFDNTLGAIVTLLFVLETIFDDRFDYETGFIKFSAYNPVFKLAVIHRADTHVCKNMESAAKWCESNDVTLVIVSNDRRTPKTILWGIIEALIDKIPLFAGYNNVSDCYQKFKLGIENKLSIGHLFDNRCVYNIDPSESIEVNSDIEKI